MGNSDSSSAPVECASEKSQEEKPAIGLEDFLRYSTQVLQFTLDSDWTILGYNREAGEQFSFCATKLRGSCLRGIIIGLNGAWAELIPESLENRSNSDNIFLPWDSVENHGLGWNLQFLAHEQTHFLSLVPMMAPEVSPSLSEEQLSLDAGSLQKTLQHLLLRTQQQEMRFRYFVRHLPGAHFTQDKDLDFSLLNDPLETLLGNIVIGYLRKGMHWRDWVHPSDVEEMDKNLELCRKGCVPVASRFRLLLPDDDRILYLMELRMPVRGLDGKLAGYEGLWLDLTRESIAERRLQQASWKESLAEISGSLSHDFNNVLGGLCGLSDLVYETVSPDNEHYDSLKIIRDKSREAVGLIQRIIALNREDWGQIELHNLAKIIEDQQELIRIILPKDAKLEMALPSEEVPVRLDAVALRRILINFTLNARDAIGYKGRVDLIAKVVNLDSYDRSFLFSTHCPTRGQGVEVIFKDDGCGIDPAIIHRIFDPYFSTKESTHYSGLGLYSLTQFARENKFDFGVRSQLGKGTEMILLIPVEEFSEVDYDDATTTSNTNSEELKSGHVAIFGKSSSYLQPIVDMLEHNNFTTDFLEEEEAVESWLENGRDEPRVLISVMSQSARLSRQLCSRLSFDQKNLLSLLVLKGLNPDHFSDFIGKTFDECYTSSSEPSQCFRRIIDFLEAKN
ncbi:MAG: ATP-binding protein [Verrucomicrobia bacterium]|nr:ATP-binding protein [Verrucomicrobiota bacterium]